MRKTISVRHRKIDEYAYKLNSMQCDRLMHAIDEGALMAVFNVNGKVITLAGAYDARLVEPVGEAVAA